MWGAKEKKLKEFIEELRKKGLRESSVEKYAVTLRKFSITSPKLTLETCKEIFRSLMDSDLSADTKIDYWRRFRVFARWARPDLNFSGYKVVVRRRKKLPDELLNVEEARSIIDSMKTIRDRAMVALLYDTGCRPGELRNLRRSDIIFEEGGMVVKLNGKTGQRRIRVVTTLGSDEFLKEYLDAYPDKMGRLMDTTEEGLIKIVKRAAERAGITKRAYPYIFRHSRATELAKYLTDAQLKVYLGWDAASEMPGVYIHLSGRDLDPRVLELNSKENPSEMPGDFKEFLQDLYHQWKGNKVRAGQRATLRALR